MAYSVWLYWPAQSPKLKPIQHLWYELKHSTSVPKLSYALVAKLDQIPAAIFQSLVENLPTGVEAVTASD